MGSARDGRGAVTPTTPSAGVLEPSTTGLAMSEHVSVKPSTIPLQTAT